MDERGSMREEGAGMAVDAEQLRELMAQRARALRETIAALAEQHPYLVVGAAFAAGYVISGALVSRTTGRLLGLGVRLLAGGMVKQALAGGSQGLADPERT